MDGFLLPTAVDSDHPEQTGAVTAAMVPDALQSYAALRAEGSVDSLASTAASFATHPAAEQLVIVAAIQWTLEALGQYQRLLWSLHSPT